MMLIKSAADVLGYELSPAQQVSLCTGLATSLLSARMMYNAMRFARRGVKLSRQHFGDASEITRNALALAVKIQRAFPKDMENPPKDMDYDFRFLMSFDLAAHGILLANERHHYETLLVLYEYCHQSIDYAMSLFRRSQILIGLCICQTKTHAWKEALHNSHEAISWARISKAKTVIYMALVSRYEIFLDLKQLDEALPVMRAAVSFSSGKNKEALEKKITETTLMAAHVDWRPINVGHDYRMCSWCWHVSKEVRLCPCTRAWYCDEHCQLQHWERHAPLCTAKPTVNVEGRC